MNPQPDIIAKLAGIATGSPLDALRARRSQARDNAEASYRALFEPAAADEFTLPERFAVAAFVVGLHGQPRVQSHYADALASLASAELVAAVAAASGAGASTGPYGSYPPGPLSREDEGGLIYRVPTDARSGLGLRLVAALEHAHLLVFRPRDASPDALQRLLEAGFSETAIVTLSQLVAFLAFQIRVVAGLTILAGREQSR